MNEISNPELIPLENGSILEIIDKSRKIAQDTWVLILIFRIKIDIDKIIIDKIKSVSEDILVDTLGHNVFYEVIHERNFIKEDLKENVLKEMRDSFLNTNLKYVSHSDFTAKCVIKKYNEKKKKY